MLPQARYLCFRYLLLKNKIHLYYKICRLGGLAYLTSHFSICPHCRLVDQAVQAAVAESNVHLFADAAVESGEPVEVVVTPTGSHIQQHQHHHRKRKERYESCNSQSQERKVIRYITFIMRDGVFILQYSTYKPNIQTDAIHTCS